MLKELAAKLDEWFVDQAAEAVREGMASPRACTIRVHGQMALVERQVKLNLVATQDVDVSGNLSGAARKEFERLLAKRGLVLDPVGHEAWMPEETHYAAFFSGRFVTLKVADEECVLSQGGKGASEEQRPSDGVSRKWSERAVRGACQKVRRRFGAIRMTESNPMAELRRRAQRKQRRLERLRRDPRYRNVVGAFAHAKLITTHVDVEPMKGPVALKDVLWAGRLEPRLLELLPAVMLKKPSLVEHGRIPPDLHRVLEQLRRNETPPDFRGIPGEKLQEWIPRVGHKGKLPTQLKAFRFRKEDVDLIEELAAERGITETDVVRAGLRALVER